MKYGRAKGSTRQKCMDCGRKEFHTQYDLNLRYPPRCAGCGGRFWEPDSDGADENFIATSSAKVARDDKAPESATNKDMAKYAR